MARQPPPAFAAALIVRSFAPEFATQLAIPRAMISGGNYGKRSWRKLRAKGMGMPFLNTLFDRMICWRMH